MNGLVELPIHTRAGGGVLRLWRGGRGVAISRVRANAEPDVVFIPDELLERVLEELARLAVRQGGADA